MLRKKTVVFKIFWVSQRRCQNSMFAQWRSYWIYPLRIFKVKKGDKFRVKRPKSLAVSVGNFIMRQSMQLNSWLEKPKSGTRSGTWTRTDIAVQWILSPSCLPIPPSGQVIVRPQSYLLFPIFLHFVSIVCWPYIRSPLLHSLLYDAKTITIPFHRGMRTAMFSEFRLHSFALPRAFARRFQRPYLRQGKPSYC